jgi:hypothetical protein
MNPTSTTGDFNAMRRKVLNFSRMTSIHFILLTLTGCWTAPNASVQPKGKPGLVQGEIVVESVQDSATVQVLDGSRREIVLKLPDGTITACAAGPGLENLDRIKAGDTVVASVVLDLSVYVLTNGRSLGVGSAARAETIHSDARVLTVDPAYRLLTLQYPGGHTETYKVGLNVKLGRIEPGCDVVIRPREVKAISVMKP